MTREETIKLALEAGFTLDNTWFNISHIEKLIDIVEVQRAAPQMSLENKQMHQAMCESPSAALESWIERW